MGQIIPIFCGSCGFIYPPGAGSHRCPECGGLFEIDPDYVYHALIGTRETGYMDPAPGVGSERRPEISLGEGNTPLVPVEVQGRRVYLKCEHLNPTGSFKDRMTAVLVNDLLRRGVAEAVEDSSGNAGASFAAYAAAAGIRARIFMPAYASGPKKLQIEAYGAEIVLVEGPRSRAAEAVLSAVDAGSVYASHAWLPHGQLGTGALAAELLDELGQAPGAVIAPAGHGSLVLGLGRGFGAALQAGLIKRLPALVGVQAKACAPLYERFRAGAEAAEQVIEGETIAEGIRIREPYRAQLVLDQIQRSEGTVLAVGEDEIEAGHLALRRRGFFVEKTSAVVWRALEQSLPLLKDPVIVILTGSGLKQAQL